MFGAGRPSGGVAQTSRTRRPNIRTASPGPSSSVPGGSLFPNVPSGSGKAPATGYPQHRDRDYQSQPGMTAELTQDQKEEISDAVCLTYVVLNIAVSE